uniref:Protein Wnt n=1 Tax=Heterorhabditis bacteriophora TaxID=37862 RepID=A0A1I7X7J8_HETBA
MKSTLFLLLLMFATNIAEIPYNWLSLALLSSSEYNPRPQSQADRGHYETLCSRLVGLNPVQKNMCIQNPFSIPFVARGVREAVYVCQIQFKYERWNCSDRHEITPTPHGRFQDILGKTLRSTTKETAFLTAIASASIVHAITKGCNTGNLTECGCDSKPALQRYVDGDQSLSPGRQEQFSWGGCSDNVPYGQKFAKS